MHKITKTMAAAGLALGLGLSGGVAYAMWNTTADLEVSGHAATVATVTASGNVKGAMLPGYYNDVTYTVHNPNSFPVEITKVRLANINSTSGTVVPASCVADFQAGLDLMGWDAPGSYWSTENAGSVIPGGHNGTFTLTDALGMGSWSTDDCQGATITLPLKVDFTVPAGTDTGL